MKTRKPKEDEVKLDRAVAARIRSVRLARGMTQTELGKRLGVTFQQVQKYENGTNRLTAGKLIILAGIFEVPVESFLKVSRPEHRAHPAPAREPLAPDQADGDGNTHRQILMLVRSFARIEDPRTRRHVLTLIR